MADKKSDITLGQCLREARNSRSILLRQLAKTLGVGKGYLSMVERNVRVPTPQVFRPWLKKLFEAKATDVICLWMQSRPTVFEPRSALHLEVLSLLWWKWPTLTRKELQDLKKYLNT